MFSHEFNKWAKKEFGLTEWSQQSDWSKAWEHYQLLNSVK